MVDGLTQSNDLKFWPPDERKFCLPLFNRATYARCKALIIELSKQHNTKVNVLLSKSLWKDCSYIRKELKGIANCVNWAVPETKGTHNGAAVKSGVVMSFFTEHLREHEYTAIVIVADRFEMLPCAYVAHLYNLPIIHIQGGEITGNIDDPCRHGITQLSDYHFVATELAREYVREMGISTDRIYWTGCPSVDLCVGVQRHNTNIKDRYMVCFFHSETDKKANGFEQTEKVMKVVLDMCAKHDLYCYWYWPNCDPGRDKVVKFLNECTAFSNGAVIKAENKPPEEFIKFLAKARVAIGNSSVLFRECSFLGVPAVNIGDRQGYRERGMNLIQASYGYKNLASAIEYQLGQVKYDRNYLYGNGKAGAWIAHHLTQVEEFTKKGTLTYPMDHRFKEDHFGEERFKQHAEIARIRRLMSDGGKPVSYTRFNKKGPRVERTKKQLGRAGRKRPALPSEPDSPK